MDLQNPKNNELVSECGLYCGACGIYIATQENDNEKILQYAMVLKQTFNDTLCDGCNSLRKSLHCSKTCTFIDCKSKKEVAFCIDCPDFPCRELNEFRLKMPHRAEIIDSQIRLKEVGPDKWLEEMKDRFTCNHCQTTNTAYQLTCRVCGQSPSCLFVSKHDNLIKQYLSQ